MPHLPTIDPGQLQRVGDGVPSNSLGQNGDLYLDRLTGRTWEKAAGAWGITFQPTLPTTKLTGQINNAQISDVDAGKITGSITGSQITSLPASKITGQVADSQIAGMSSSKLIGQILDAQIAAMAASKLTGTVADSQIAGMSASKLIGLINLATQVSGSLPDGNIAGMSASKLIGSILNAQITSLDASKLTGTAPAGVLPAGYNTKITTSSMAGGPPGSPSDGDIWIATGISTFGPRWAFQYNAGSPSPYKWEFIGGAPARPAEGSASTITSTSYVDLTSGVSFTVPRAGDYAISFGGKIYNAATTDHVFIAVSKGAGASDNDSVSVQNHPVIDSISVAKETTATGLSASAVVKLQMRVVGGSGFGDQIFMAIGPVRIS